MGKNGKNFRPSCMDGTDTVLSPRIYRTAVARLLGQPVFSSPAPCPLCESKQAGEFDEKVSQTVFQCLGLKPTDEAYAQASVSTTIGGLGVRRILDHANGAFTASWHEAQVITGEKWIKPPDKDCSGVYNSQHAASATTDAAIMTKLKATANRRDAQRLNRLDSPHANAWLSARPSCMDGTDTVLPPRIYRTAVARLLDDDGFYR